MNSRVKWWTLAAADAVALFLTLGARPAPSSATQLPPANPPPRYQVLDADLSSLRSQFNQDAGHIRILMLLSPT
jgi:hypothetical protein